MYGSEYLNQDISRNYITKYTKQRYTLENKTFMHMRVKWDGIIIFLLVYDIPEDIKDVKYIEQVTLIIS